MQKLRLREERLARGHVTAGGQGWDLDLACHFSGSHYMFSFIDLWDFLPKHKMDSTSYACWEFCYNKSAEMPREPS